MERQALVPATLPYNSEFYARSSDEVVSSSRTCVPLIMDLLTPVSVVDLGCGQGDWLCSFQNCGVQDLLGVDGDYVKREELRIAESSFYAWDLSQPLELRRRFDLAVSLEVAEHLPPSFADQFVRQLVNYAPAVVFSAAVPGQGGIHHVNEQWPWYWKELFARYGYVQLDPFRKRIWKDASVAVYYQHNLFLYIDPKVHQAQIDRIGVQDKYSELTLVRTSILQQLTRPSLAARIRSRFGRLLSFGSKKS